MKFLVKLVVFLSIAALLSSCSHSKVAGPAITREDVREIVRQVIKENPKLIYDTITPYARKTRTEAQIKARLEESFQNRVKDENPVSADNPAKGPSDAPITIIEYTDFQCSYCGKAAKIIDEVMELYPEKVRLVFKNNPLKMHPLALPAARAALAAHKQGKFWEYHDLLFKNFTSLHERRLLKYAEDLGLDPEKFNKDRNSEEIAKQIESEQSWAVDHKFTGTPTFIINGVALKGALPKKYFTMAIDRLLAEGK